MKRRRRALAVAALALGAAGCLLQQPALSYQFRQQGFAEVLYPPRPRPGAAKPARLSLRLAPGTHCQALAGSFDAAALGLQWSLAGGHLAIVVAPEVGSYDALPPVELLNGVHALHQQLDQAVAQGCLTPGAGAGVLRRTAESLPIAPSVAQAIVLGAYATQRYIDVAEPVELQLTYALRRDAPSRYDLGYAAQDYRAVPTTTDGRGHLELIATAVKDAPTPHQPLTPPVEIATGGPPRFYRLLFLVRGEGTDHDVGLLAAETRATLELATHELLSRPQACAGLRMAEAACTLMPPDVGLEARLRVRIEGRRTTVPVTATVEVALAESGVRDPTRVLPTLRVLRPYGAGYAPVAATANRRALLDLLLCGDEDISW